MKGINPAYEFDILNAFSACAALIIEPSLFRRQTARYQSLDHFVDMIYSSQMTYWASDLLSKRLSPSQIREAVQMAIIACKHAGEDAQRHFKLMYTSSTRGVTFDDCKMSKLGYRLTVLNASPKNKYIARVQLKLAQGLQ